MAERSETLQREALFERKGIDQNARTVPVTLSTETPVDRGGFDEILGHGAGEVDLSRAPLPLIESHDDKRLPIGVVEGLRVEGRKLRGLARFSKSTRAAEIFTDIVDGILRAVSVGYKYLDDGTPEGKRGLRFKWQPLEASAVSIGADPNAGFMRKGYAMQQRNSEDEGTRAARAERNFAARQKIKEWITTLPPDDADGFRDHISDLALEHELDDVAIARSMGNIDRAYETWRRDSIMSIAAMWSSSDEDGDMKRLAAAAALNPKQSVTQFRKELLEMIASKHRSDTDTGALEAGVQSDRQAFGEAARVDERHSGLANIKGKNAEARAYQAGMYFRSLVGDQQAAQWCRDKGLLQQRSLGTGVFSAGGALIPDPIENEIINLREQFSVFRRFARQWPMETSSLGIPVKTAGMSVSAVAESQVTPTSDPAFAQVSLVAKEFAGGTRVHRNLIEDSPIALGDFIVGEFGLTLAETEDACGFIGTGISTYAGMRGITFLLEDGNHAGGAVDATSGHDSFAEVDVTDLVNLMGRLPEYARAGAAWYLSSTARDMIFTRLMMGAGGNTVETLRSGAGENFMGYPVRVSQKLPAGATTTYNGKVIVLFGNLQQSSAFGARRGVQVDIDSSRFVEYREIYFQATERFDIVSHHVGTSSEAGPIVGLVGKT